MISTKNASLSYEPNINGSKPLYHDALSIDSNLELDFDSKVVASTTIRPTDSINSIIKPKPPSTGITNSRHETEIRRLTNNSVSIADNSRLAQQYPRPETSSQERLRKSTKFK